MIRSASLWGAVFSLPIFCCWSCHTSDHIHVQQRRRVPVCLHIAERATGWLLLLRFPICAVGVEQGHTLIDNAMFQQLGQVHTLTDLNQVDQCLKSSPPHLNSCRHEFLPWLLRARFLGKRQQFAQRNGSMEVGILTEHPLSQETGQCFFPAAGAELKSATSVADAGIADCRVRRIAEAGSNGRYSNDCMYVTRSCTHCSSYRIRYGPHSKCFLLASFRLTRSL